MGRSERGCGGEACSKQPCVHGHALMKVTKPITPMPVPIAARTGATRSIPTDAAVVVATAAPTGRHGGWRPLTWRTPARLPPPPLPPVRAPRPPRRRPDPNAEGDLRATPRRRLPRGTDVTPAPASASTRPRSAESDEAEDHLLVGEAHTGRAGGLGSPATPPFRRSVGRLPDGADAKRLADRAAATLRGPADRGQRLPSDGQTPAGDGTRRRVSGMDPRRSTSATLAL